MTLTKDQILFTLCHLPHLEYLDISNGRGHTMQFNWRDLNILHQSLQKLKCLKLGINLETISLKDISLISKMDKATKLLCLEFCSKDVDLGWLYYWANKYPNIRTITWVSKRGMSRLIDVIYNGYPEMRTLDSPFRHLDTINLNYKEGQSRMTHVLLDKLHELNIPIKNISCAIKIRISDLTDGAETTDKILKFSQTLLSLDLQIQGRSHDTLAISQALCYCPLLVDLRITAPFMTFKINEILDTFPSLKTLHLSSKRVFIEQNEPLGMHHGLKEFWMRDTQTVYRLFSYLSNRCRQLKCLFLRGVLIPGIARAKNAVVPIQMKYSSLDTFQMIDIVFSYQLNYSLGSYCETAVLFKITQYNSVGQDGDTNSVTWHRNYLSTKNKPSEWQRIRGSYDWNEILKKKRYSALAGLVSLECVSVKNVII
ncbi:hypothetical protein CLU79DRAFT_759652 [Phycomyces nitens]|nr:hypothetical protein CLU79DRAFT_759652 [Phycomyces nitens]